MGADEKHAATYRGGEYTPTTAIVHSIYMTAWNSTADPVDQQEIQDKARDEFTRWLETIRAEAKAEALNEVANAFQYKAWSELIQGSLQDRLRVAQPITAWLRARANQYKEEPANGR